MIISAIDLYYISQQLASPFETSFGRQVERQCLLLALHGDGLTGWGECVANSSPGYSYETAQTAWYILEDFLIPKVLGFKLDQPGELVEQLNFVRGHPLAKATLDFAAWDLLAQCDGISLSEKLNKPYQREPRKRVEVGVSIGIQESIDQTLSTVQKWLDKGYRRIKLKIRPGHDLDLAIAARAAFPETAIMLDANSAYRLEDARIFQQMDDLNLLMIEQPLGYEDIYDHSQLKNKIQTPLCLDESIHSVDHTRFAIAINACDIINIKPARVGGLTEARAVHDLCYENDIPVWCGGMLETGVGRAGQLALASLPGFVLPGDISATERYYAEDIARPDFVLNTEDSTIDVPSGPGIGVTVDFDRLESVTLRKARFEL